MPRAPTGNRAMATFRCRSAFISDVHLGTPDCKAAYLLDFLRRLRAKSCIWSATSSTWRRWPDGTGGKPRTAP